MKVLNVECIGVEKRTYPTKHYVYILSVSWDNGLKHPIYRTYSAFFDFLACLREELKNRNDVTLPELPVLKWFERGRLGGLTSGAAAEKRKKYINDFCQKILHMPSEFVAGRTVESFFETWNSDFTQQDTSYSQQSQGEVRLGLEVLRKLSLPESTHELIRCNSVDETRGQRLFPLKRHTQSQLPSYHGDAGDIMGNLSDCLGSEKKASTSSDPTAGDHHSTLRKFGSTESFDSVKADLQYRVIGDFTKRKPGEVSLTEGEIVDVLETDLSGWWFVHIDEPQKQGWAPGALLEPLNSNNREEQTPDAAPAAVASAMPGYFFTTVAYQGQRPDELSYSQGQEVEVLEARMDGWWKVRCNNQIGYIPATHLEEQKNSSDGKNRKNLQQPLGCGLYYQQTIYKKRSPPPRRVPKANRDALHTITESQSAQPESDTDMANKLNRENMQRKQVLKKKPAPLYTEIEFEDDEEGGNRRPIIGETSSTEYAEIQVQPTTEGAGSKEGGEPTKPPPKLEPRHNYVNINIPPKECANFNLQSTEEEEEGGLFECLQDYKPKTSHIECLRLKKGDIVKVEVEDGERYFCMKCAKNKKSKPEEGWVPKEILRETKSVNIAGETKHAVPIVKKDSGKKEKPPPLKLASNSVSSDEGSLILPPMPCLASPKPPEKARKAQVSPSSLSTKVKAQFDFKAPKGSEKTMLSFKKDEEGKLMSKGASGWWCVNTGSKVGWVPGDYWQVVEEEPQPPPRVKIESEAESPLYSQVQHISHTEEPWFVGKMARSACESLMKAHQKDGSFLIREGTHLSGSFTLSVYYHGRLRHFAVKQTDDGRLNIGDYNFKTLGKVVRYYQGHPLFYEEDKAVCLTDPVPVSKQELS